jgi:hypothetical protein
MKAGKRKQQNENENKQKANGRLILIMALNVNFPNISIKRQSLSEWILKSDPPICCL